MPFIVIPLTKMDVQATTEQDEEIPPEITVPDEPVVAEATRPQGSQDQ
jgi:hypothetical protein